MIERMYDYVYSRASLPAGSSLVGEVLQTDTECPWAMRGRAIYSESVEESHQSHTLRVSTRFTDARDRYRAAAVVPASLDIPFAGYNGIFSPVRPQILFPPGGIIQQDISNPSTNSNLTSFLLIYRGVRLYNSPTGYAGRTLPNARVDIRSFSWSYPPAGVTVTIAPTQTIQRIPFQIDNTDFILRAIQVGTQSSPRYNSLMIQLRDGDQKPYSSLPIPIDYLCGNASARVNNTFQNVQVGNWIPGLVFPEIYMRANEYLFFDLIRNDPGGVDNILTFNFIGARVTPA